MNTVILTGNVCTDPEAYTTQGGVSRSSFRIAVRRNYRNPNGEYDSDFLNVVVWRGTADYCNKYVKKGRRVCVEGSIQTRSYDAQDGSKRHVTEIIGESIELLDRPENGGGERPARPANRPAPAPKGEFEQVDPGDDLPF